MGSILIGKKNGRWFFRAQGCCGMDSYRRDYNRAHAVQVLAEGGRLTGWDAISFELTDRRGRIHQYDA